MKYKVGDYVKRIGPEYTGIGLTPEEYGLGEDLEIREVSSGFYKLKRLNGTNNNLSAWEKHLIPSEIMNSPLMKALK